MCNGATCLSFSWPGSAIDSSAEDHGAILLVEAFIFTFRRGRRCVSSSLESIYCERADDFMMFHNRSVSFLSTGMGIFMRKKKSELKNTAFSPHSEHDESREHFPFPFPR